MNNAIVVMVFCLMIGCGKSPASGNAEAAKAATASAPTQHPAAASTAAPNAATAKKQSGYDNYVQGVAGDAANAKSDDEFFATLRAKRGE